MCKDFLPGKKKSGVSLHDGQTLTKKSEVRKWWIYRLPRTCLPPPGCTQPLLSSEHDFSDFRLCALGSARIAIFAISDTPRAAIATLAATG